MELEEQCSVSDPWGNHQQRCGCTYSFDLEDTAPGGNFIKGCINRFEQVKDLQGSSGATPLSKPCQFKEEHGKRLQNVSYRKGQVAID